jgi:hypothetical protein
LPSWLDDLWIDNGGIPELESLQGGFEMKGFDKDAAIEVGVNGTGAENPGFGAASGGSVDVWTALAHGG